MSKLRYLALIFIVLIANSCSMSSLAVKNLDWIISRQVKNHLDLYYNQEKILNLEVSQFLKRQKKQVPSLLQHIETLGGISNNDFQKIEDIEKFRLNLQSIYFTVADDFNANILAPHLSEMNEPQLKHFRKENNKKNIELKNKINDNDSDIFKRIEFLIGKFTDNQIKILKNIQPQIRVLQKLRLRRKKEFQIKLYQVISTSTLPKQEITKKTEIQKLFYNYIHKIDLENDPIVLKQNENNNKAINQAILQIFNSLTQEQMKILQEKVRWLKNVVQSFKATKY